MSQPPKTTSLRGARGTKSEMRGLRPSVSLPWAGAMGRPFALVIDPSVIDPPPYPSPRSDTCARLGPNAKSGSLAHLVAGTEGDRGSGGRDASGAVEEGEGGGGQLAVVARSYEAPLALVVVEDARAGEVLLRLER